jgi:DNA-binding LacI/PurR family transcriptional regulator
LLEAGHRDLAFIAGPPDHLAALARREGFEAALTDCPRRARADRRRRLLHRLGRARSRAPARRPDRPTALFAANDRMAAGALRAAAALGLSVPRDLAVAGFDDSSIARLTTPPDLGAPADRRSRAPAPRPLLIAAASAGEPLSPVDERLACTIVERESTATSR